MRYKKNDKYYTLWKADENVFNMQHGASMSTWFFSLKTWDTWFPHYFESDIDILSNKLNVVILAHLCCVHINLDITDFDLS